MVSPVMIEYIDRIESALYHEEKLVLAVRGFIELFPFISASLFNYSPLNQMGEGILHANEQGLFSIQELRENVRNIPPILSVIRERKSKLVDSRLIRQIPAKYVQGLSYVIIVPICHGRTVMGFAGISGQPEGFKPVEDSLLHSLTLYGQLVGKAMANDRSENESKLTNREIEVLQRMSWGESSQEIAKNIGISVFTVQDYVKSALRKLNAQNRAQGVAEAFRRGIIQ
ncbi:helix-turn-helix transcriptional regulator [Lihuaxuella thermophila]|uniref:Regulatory protein, luxR family n=1 Tax=Lihuaxuella thermophila TaxID=1173111 RepID=A0A1H8GHJ5_9BACL|nr:LuxR C-terminal-related transcriptional regulator [Lihuaxuella thermophila]SEN42957.1 regulatory protein, luxR family [Lihuaxuella thermophila]